VRHCALSPDPTLYPSVPLFQNLESATDLLMARARKNLSFYRKFLDFSFLALRF